MLLGEVQLRFSMEMSDGLGASLFLIYRCSKKHSSPLTLWQHNWNNMGLRLTESGSVKIDRIVVPWEDALGWDSKAKEPLPELLTTPWATLLLPT